MMKFPAGRKFLLIKVAMLLALAAFACDKRADNPAGSLEANKPLVKAGMTAPIFFSVSLSTEPAEAKPSEPVKLTFGLQDSNGKALASNDLEIVHEKLMHLLLVSDDLSYFDHIHPEANASGDFSVETKFPAAGRYRLYLDYTPKGGGHQLGRMYVNVAGTPPPPIKLVADKELSKTIGDLRVVMRSNKPLRAKDPVQLSFAVADAKSAQPVTDLEPYLGAFAHFVLISEDNQEYLHAHPLVEASGPSARGGPEVGTQAIFPKPGLYKVWAQFQHRGKIVIAPFVITVGEGGPAAPAALAQNDNGTQKIKVTVSENGFEPGELQLKRGIPAQITFLRTDEKNCGHEVIFSELGIRKQLNVGQPVTVEFTPEKNGELKFTCGMGMLRGSVAVVN